MKRTRGFRLTIQALLLVTLTACSSHYKNEVNFNTLEPLRVAVMPFAFIGEDGKFTKSDDQLFVDNIGLVSSKLKESPEQYLQKSVQNRLSNSALDLISPAIVDAQLSHRGFLNPKLEYDLPKIFSFDKNSICRELLSCDALLYGKVTRWNRSYYGIQSVSSVGIELSLVSAKDGKVLYHATAEDADSRGITKGPTGFSNLVLEPLKGLDNQIILDLASQVVDKALSPLYIKSRPEFLSTPPPAIFASAHNADQGVLPKERALTVLMYGSPDLSASFSIGNYAEHIPMSQKDQGHYIGEFYALPSDHFEALPIYVKLTDRFGRSTLQKVGHTSISLR